MGNQNTSGIAEEKARVSSAHDQREEADQTVLEDGEGGEGKERSDFFQEKTAEAAENGPLRTSLEVSEEHEGSVNEGPETQTSDLLNGSIDHGGLKDMTCDEMQDQPCTLKEEMQSSETANSAPKSTSEIANPDSPSLLESAHITSETQEDHDTLETIKSLRLDDEKPTMNELVNGGKRRSCADQDTDHSAMIKSDDTDDEVEVGSNHGSDKIGVPDEEAPQDDQHKSSDETTLENAVTTTAKNQGNEYPTSDVEKAPQDDQHISSDETTLENVVITTTRKQGNEYPTSDVGSNHGSDKIGLPDEKAPQEEQHISSDETLLENAVTTTTKQQGNEYPTSDVGSNHGSGKISIPGEKAPQEEQHISSDETTLENAVITTTRKQGNDYPTPDEKAPQEEQHVSSDETIRENAVITTARKQGNDYPTSDVCENLDIIGSSDPSYKGSRLELRKFPSSDFGLERTEESDRTPLLYNDNSGATARSVQIEHYESSTTADSPLNQQSNSVSEKEKGIGSEGSTPSTKGSGKRKPRSSSSLFTTCLCCTAVIN